MVTGAAGGFGEAIARKYAQEGASVVIADILLEAGQKVADEINEKHGDKAIALSFDVTKKDHWETGLKQTLDKFRKLDIVMNNAGTTYRKKPSVEVTEDDFDKIIAVNCKSIYQSVQVIMPYFVERKSGVFLSTSSVAGTRVRPGQVFYGGTKGFVNVVSTPNTERNKPLTVLQITQGLAAEYGPAGVRVNSICPLRGKTGLLEHFSGVPDTPEERERFAQSVPLRRMSTADDVANAAVFLASDDASFISGVNFPVDGARLAV